MIFALLMNLLMPHRPDCNYFCTVRRDSGGKITGLIPVTLWENPDSGKPGTGVRPGDRSF